jgi:hypothetical protein
MGECSPWPENSKESEEENAEPTEPVQLALTGGGHTAEGKGPHMTPHGMAHKRPKKRKKLRMLLHEALFGGIGQAPFSH